MIRIDAAAAVRGLRHEARFGIAAFVVVQVIALLDEFANLLVENTPVAPQFELHPGKLRASWWMQRGSPGDLRLPDAASYAVPGSDLWQRQLAGLQLGEAVFITNDAETRQGSGESYAQIIDQGRHTDSRGRPAGSLQRPEGIVKAALAALEAG